MQKRILLNDNLFSADVVKALGDFEARFDALQLGDVGGVLLQLGLVCSLVDLDKLILSAVIDATEYFVTPADDVAPWRTRGVEGREKLSEAFLLFDDDDHVYRFLAENQSPNVTGYTLYTLSRSDGMVCLNEHSRINTLPPGGSISESDFPFLTEQQGQPAPARRAA